MSERFDAAVADWIREGPDRGPAEGLQRALAATSRVSQRPAWTFPQRWLPEVVVERGAQVPRAVGWIALLVLTLLALLAIALAFAGARPQPRPLNGPYGGALLAFEESGVLYVSALDGSERRSISAGIANASSPVFSADGSRVALLASSSIGVGSRLMVVPVDGSAGPIEVGGGLDVLGGEVPSVAWSSDGTRIAFAAGDAGTSRIYVVPAVGGTPTVLTDSASNADLPAWTPDGSWIAYRVIERDGQTQHLRQVRPDGTEAEDLTSVLGQGAHLSRLRWRPPSDGFSYAANFGFGTETKAILDLAFGHNAELWGNGIGGSPDAGIPWAPDGSRLAVLTENDGVVLADYDNSLPSYDGQVVPIGHVAECWIEWSPDGKALYGGSPNGCQNLVVIPFDDPGSVTTLPIDGHKVASWQPLGDSR